MTETFGMGAVIAGGHRTAYVDNKMARFFCLSALLQLKSILSSGPKHKYYAVFGPGLMALYLGLSGDVGGELFAYNMMFYLGLGGQISVTSTTALELRAGYNIVPTKGWSGEDENGNKPGDFSGNGATVSFSLLFGGD